MLTTDLSDDLDITVRIRNGMQVSESPGPSKPTTDESSHRSAIFLDPTHTVLGISKHRVEQNHIRNEHIRNLFGVADIHDQLQLRTFRWLGQLARQPNVTATKRLLSAWITTPRRSGSQRATARSTYVETIRTILDPDIMT
jgi:hypothetical protein